MNSLALPTPAPNAAAKSQLARLMATENITVEYDPSAQTASFNMESRLLTLPVWKDLSDDALDMLIGHEVSHALHTPAGAKPLMDAVNAIDSKNPMVAKDYINVVEDARIERMIKTRFPGLKRSFAHGYRQLMERDLFGIKGKSLADLPLIDRINLQYKIGWLIDVPFSAAELPLAKRVATTITWDDVVSLSKEIYEFAKQQQQDQNQGGDSDQSDGAEGENGEEGVGAGSESQEGDKDDNDTDSLPSPTDEDGEEEDGDSKGSDSETDSDADEESDSTGEGEEGENADAEDGNMGGESKSDTDMDADSEAKDDGESEEGDSKGKPEEAKSTKNPAPMSQTARATEQALGRMIDTTAAKIYYADLPDPDKGYVIPLKEVQKSLREWTAQHKGQTAATAAYAAWKTNNAPAVQVLATEFDRRKAADAHKRTAIAETGALDPNRLHAYRIAEDIFLQNAYVKDGKNHGIVLLLDMSGSMGPIFHDTMIQLVTLAHFCRRVNVPFSFYGYTDRDDKKIAREPSFKKTSFGAEQVRTRLFTLLSDGMKQNEFMELCGMLLLASYSAGSGLPQTHPTLKAIEAYKWQKPYYPPEWMALDNTPTNGALLGMPYMVEEFKRVKRVQIANLIVLTDGEPSDSMTQWNYYAHGEKNRNNPNAPRNGDVRVVWRDTKKRKEYGGTYTYVGWDKRKHEYELSRDDQGATLMQIVRDRSGAKTICIHLTGKRNGSGYAKEISGRTVKGESRDPKQNQVYANARLAVQEKTEEFWSENDWVGIPNGKGFDEYILVRTDTKVEDWDLDEVDMNSKSGLRDLRKTFTKSMAATRANRPLLTRVADLISKK